MSKKKINHISPRCLLKEWSTKGGIYSGVFVYEVNNRKNYFSHDKGSGAFSFASEKYFYMPKISSTRISFVEDWLAECEFILSKTINKIKLRNDGVMLKSIDEFEKLLSAVFSLNFRSKSTIERIRKTLLENPPHEYKILIESGASIEGLLMQNLVNSIKERAKEYIQTDMTICFTINNSLILSDSPFLFEVVDGYSFLALSPTILMVLKKSSKGNGLINYMDNGDEFADIYNKKIAENADDWIIANNENLLNKHIDFVPKNKAQITPVYKLIQYLKKEDQCLLPY